MEGVEVSRLLTQWRLVHRYVEATQAVVQASANLACSEYNLFGESGRPGVTWSVHSAVVSHVNSQRPSTTL